jgi:hypothetical protein
VASIWYPSIESHMDLESGRLTVWLGGTEDLRRRIVAVARAARSTLPPTVPGLAMAVAWTLASGCDTRAAVDAIGLR